MAVNQPYKEYRVLELPTIGLKAGDRHYLDVGAGKYITFIVNDSFNLIRESGAEFIEKDTMADFRAITEREIWAIQNGYYKGVKLNGYYKKGDTPSSIEYFISTVTNTDDGGSVIEINGIKFEHIFISYVHPSYFGILSSKTLRQDTQLKNFSNYVDRANIYELDFHNYNIVAPKNLLFTTKRPNPVRGLGFKKVHKIKNLSIINDKTEQLKTGDNCIVFYPSEDAEGVFELDNVTFDPYNPDYSIAPVTGTEYDGLMLGFLCYADVSWLDFSHRTLTKYSVKINNVEFISPAISYNISLAGIFMQENTITNIKGDFWGLYAHVFAKKVFVNNASGIFRNDLHANSGRLLVTTLIHQEPEIAVSGNNTPTVINQDQIILEKLKCLNNNGLLWIAFKHHSVAPYYIENINVSDCYGNFQVYTPSTTVGHTVVNNIFVRETNYIDVTPVFYMSCNVNNLYCDNTKLNHSTAEFALIGSRNPLMLNVSFKNSIVKNLSYQGQGTGVINNLFFDNCIISSGSDIGVDNLIRNTGVTVKNVKISNTTVNCKQILQCIFEKVELDNIVFTDPKFINTFYQTSSAGIVSNISLNKIKINADLVTQTDFFILGTTGSTLTYSINNSYTGRRLRIGTGVTRAFEAGTYPIDSGTTAARPTGLDARSLGYMYNDTTLGKAIVWNGTSWLTGEPNATTSVKGLVNQSAISADTATTPSATYTQAEVQAILTELRDLKTKLRTAGILAT